MYDIGGKARRKETTGKTKAWVDNTELDLERDRMGLYGLDRSGSGYGEVEGSCEHGNEFLGSIRFWEVLEELYNWWLLHEVRPVGRSVSGSMSQNFSNG
jgi:hypothetical protein